MPFVLSACVCKSITKVSILTPGRSPAASCGGEARRGPGDVSRRLRVACERSTRPRACITCVYNGQKQKLRGSLLRSSLRSRHARLSHLHLLPGHLPHRRRSTSGPSRLRCLSGSTGPFRDTSARAEGLIGPSHPGGTAHALPSDRAGRPRLGAGPAARRRPPSSKHVATAGRFASLSGSPDTRESQQLERRRSRRSSRGA